MEPRITPPEAAATSSRTSTQTKRNWRAFYASLGVATVWALAHQGSEMKRAPMPKREVAPSPAAPVARKPEPPSCTTTGRDYDLKDEAVLRIAPRDNAAPIVKPGLANDPDAAVHATLVGRVPLREICRNEKWARISVLAPEYLRWMTGWVPVSALKPIKVDATGRRIYVAGDIAWEPGSEAHKVVILKVANRIATEDRTCEAIDPASLLVEGERRNPQFTLSCVGKTGTTPITFTADDLRNGRSFAAAPQAADGGSEPINRTAAGIACMDAIRPQLRQPGSVDFNLFDNTYNAEGARARYTITFSAKNGFGNAIEATAECVFEGSRLASATVIN